MCGAVKVSPKMKWRFQDVGDIMDVGHLYREVVGSIWNLLNREAMLLQVTEPRSRGTSTPKNTDDVTMSSNFWTQT